MYVYLQAYKHGLPSRQSGDQPLFAFVSLYLANRKVFETPPSAVVPDASSRLGTMPLSFTLGIHDVPPGRYDCQVTILDPATLKANFWRAPVLLVR
jgi:hypothetical protein